MAKRPMAVTLISLLYIATGVLGLVFHVSEDLKGPHPFQSDIFIIALVELAAIVSGVFMLRGADWARWLAIAWIAFHVIRSVFDSWKQVAVHALLCALFSYLLFRSQTTPFFRRVRTS